MSNITDFAERIKGLGFRVFIAKAGLGNYGFITDSESKRVLSFSFHDGGTLSGNYGPPSTSSGTGWRIDGTPWDLVSAGDVTRALYSTPGRHCGTGWKYFTSVEQHLAIYGKSSKYEEA